MHIHLYLKYVDTQRRMLTSKLTPERKSENRLSGALKKLVKKAVRWAERIENKKSVKVTKAGKRAIRRCR